MARPMAGPMDIRQIAALLADRCADLCADILPAGRQDGREWRVGSVAGEPGQSLAVHLGGPKAGVWCDFGGPDHHRGDLVELIAQVKCAGDKRAAIGWARRWLGIDDGDPAALERMRTQAVAKRAKRQLLAMEKREAVRRKAFGLWLSGQARLVGTPVAAYLAGRGIDLARLGRQPGALRALRFHPACWCCEADAPLPALLAAISGEVADPATGEIKRGFLAVHRTWLAPDGRGGWGKAPLAYPRLTWGDYRGGCIALWRGGAGTPLSRMAAGERVLAGEGIEDALSPILSRPTYRALAAVSLSNLGNLALPAPADITILAQNEWHNRVALGQLDRAVGKLVAGGHTVRLARPPAALKDFNDLLQELEARRRAAADEGVA